LRILHGVSLCSGIGGKELGLKLALGSAYRTVLYCERDAAKSAALVARMEDEALDRAPVWDDVSTVAGEARRLGLRGVDLLTAGYPCQPFSVAGSRRGADDPRHLWPHIARTIRVLRPGLVFCENVAGHLSLGFEKVVSDMEGMGYRVAAGVFPALEAGAPHLRERLYWLGVRANVGHTHEPRRQGRRLCTGERPRQRPAWPAGREARPEDFHEGLEPGIRRTPDGTPGWADRLRACGEAVVPVVAGYAFCTLADALGLVDR
jgi:DNA (cytosine-5)-methyltransferase 1